MRTDSVLPPWTSLQLPQSTKVSGKVPGHTSCCNSRPSNQRLEKRQCMMPWKQWKGFLAANLLWDSSPRLHLEARLSKKKPRYVSVCSIASKISRILYLLLQTYPCESGSWDSRAKTIWTHWFQSWRTWHKTVVQTVVHSGVSTVYCMSCKNHICLWYYSPDHLFG